MVSASGIGPGGELVWAGEKLRAVLFDGAHDKLIVTFDHFDPTKNRFPDCVSSSLFADRGFANLRLQSAANDWYINTETDLLERVIADLVPRFRFRSALGYSMGGYAAFRFAQAIASDWTVAISPQVSLARSEAPREWRWKESRQRFDLAKGSLRSRGLATLQGILAFDPMIPQDRHHAYAIQRLFPAVTLVPMCFAGHPASPLLADVGQSGLIREAALDQSFDPRVILAAYRGNRRRVERYWRNRASKTLKRRPDVALAAQGALSALSAISNSGPSSSDGA